METVAPHAGCSKFFRQPVELGHLRLRAVKRGVEAGDLPQRRPGLRHRADRGDFVGLVGARERNQRIQCSQDTIVDDHRLRVILAAVHDAMAGRHDLILARGALEPRHHVRNRIAVTEITGIGAGRERFVNRFELLRAGDKARRMADIGNFAAQQRVAWNVGSRRVEREFNAGRPGVENQYHLVHARVSLC